MCSFEKSKKPLANAALALHVHALAQLRVHIQRFRKLRFTCATTVYIGMVEEIDALIQRRVDQLRNFRFRQAGNAHTAQRDFRGVEVEVGDGECFHDDAFL
jgi:hypothetical protein